MDQLGYIQHGQKKISIDKITFKSSITHGNKWCENGLRLKKKRFITIQIEKPLAAGPITLTSKIKKNSHLLHETGQHNYGITDFKLI
jgi:hypothetical protein